MSANPSQAEWGQKRPGDAMLAERPPSRRTAVNESTIEKATEMYSKSVTGGAVAACRAVASAQFDAGGTTTSFDCTPFTPFTLRASATARLCALPLGTFPYNVTTP